MFTCEAVGHVLRAAAEEHPACEITVLCGHTHGSGRVEMLPNLTAFTKGAQYGRPEFLLLDPVEQDFGLSAHNWTDAPDER